MTAFPREYLLLCWVVDSLKINQSQRTYIGVHMDSMDVHIMRFCGFVVCNTICCLYQCWSTDVLFFSSHHWIFFLMPWQQAGGHQKLHGEWNFHLEKQNDIQCLSNVFYQHVSFQKEMSIQIAVPCRMEFSFGETKWHSVLTKYILATHINLQRKFYSNSNTL